MGRKLSYCRLASGTGAWIKPASGFSAIMKTVIVGAVGAICLFTCDACGGKSAAPVPPSTAVHATGLVHQVPHGTPIKLAFIANDDSAFWRLAAKGVERANAEFRMKMEVKVTETGTVEQQRRILRDLVSQGYHGIAISLICPDEEMADVNRAADVLNVITHDSDGFGSKCLAFIGTNNYEAGRVLGGQLKRLLPAGGKVAAFVGTLATDTAKLRLAGVKVSIASSAIEVVVTKEDDRDMTKARRNVDDVINDMPDVAGLIGLGSDTPAIVAAVQARGMSNRFVVVGFDGKEATLQGVESGLVQATVVQKPFEFGYRSAKLLYELADRGEAALPAKRFIDTGVEVVTKENVADFKSRLAQLMR